ncbi:hypothetical protein AQUCO_00300037v1 [Aquilegia coerulea]|uniref:PPM-type phosphatase domain-containing protein n=1 Tax=Aquilegia coerulea TaxID=218851 RepID=A0A2G5EWZ5_AQUCA|nr:hypothetical protein AQUCO_00300037v1 [Aquilegia coerulea]
MGNGIGKLSVCFTGQSRTTKHDISMLISEPLDEGLGHSFCYVRPDPNHISLSKVHSEDSTTTTFRSISGASVSANTSTPLSTALIDLYSYNSIDRAAAFESSTSFASIPLQPVPRGLLNSTNSGPFSGDLNAIMNSKSIERGFLSGPIERGFMSGPLDNKESDHFQRSFSHGGFAFKSRSKTGSLIRVLRKAISKTVSRGQNSIVTPIKGVFSVKESDWMIGSEKNGENFTVNSINLSSELSMEDDDCLHSQNLQWAQGKAGEDRVHVVISEEYGWIFVGIYDGFNGPDAPDYLLSNLYNSVHRELKGLLWEDKYEPATTTTDCPPDTDCDLQKTAECDQFGMADQTSDSCCSQCDNRANFSLGDEEVYSPNMNSKRSSTKRSKNSFRGPARKWEESQERWRCQWDRERLELDRKLKEHLSQTNSEGTAAINHNDVLKALSVALKKTEEAYLDLADKMLMENPELALMGSCVLVMLMKGEDVYVMNVGDSRAVLAQKAEPDLWLGNTHHDLEKINEETLHDLESCDGDQSHRVANLAALQLTLDHSTSIEEEVRRIKNEHPDDCSSVVNDRVKGSLKVTRAFGAGFLKQVYHKL